jgi:hypothetical protein
MSSCRRPGWSGRRLATARSAVGVLVLGVLATACGVTATAPEEGKRASSAAAPVRVDLAQAQFEVDHGLLALRDRAGTATFPVRVQLVGGTLGAMPSQERDPLPGRPLLPEHTVQLPGTRGAVLAWYRPGPVPGLAVASGVGRGSGAVVGFSYCLAAQGRHLVVSAEATVQHLRPRAGACPRPPR